MELKSGGHSGDALDLNANPYNSLMDDDLMGTLETPLLRHGNPVTEIKPDIRFYYIILIIGVIQCIVIISIKNKLR